MKRLIQGLEGFGESSRVVNALELAEAVWKANVVKQLITIRDSLIEVRDSWSKQVGD